VKPNGSSFATVIMSTGMMYKSSATMSLLHVSTKNSYQHIIYHRFTATNITDGRTDRQTDMLTIIVYYELMHVSGKCFDATLTF
jgi:hypothetical protein